MDRIGILSIRLRLIMAAGVPWAAFDEAFYCQQRPFDKAVLLKSLDGVIGA